MAKYEDKKWFLAVLGSVLGLGIILLAHYGNPGNMGLCTICFLRDIAGSLGLHQAAVVQYFRPEIVGIVLGAFGMAVLGRRLNLRSGSSPAIRFALGLIMGVLGLVFLGCTLRMIIRMAAGDISGYVGFVGFILGSWVGISFLRNGFDLGEGTIIRKGDTLVLPTIFLTLFILFLIVPQMFIFSEEGPGSMHAPIILSLIVGLAFGAIGQRVNLCMSGSLRNILSIGDFTAAVPVLGMFFTLLIYNIISGNFAFTAYGPIAHAQHLWNILPMFGIGLASALGGGCPVRQLIKAGSGNGDGLLTTLGIFVGVAMAHNFGLTSAGASEEAIGGPSAAGKIAVLVSLVVLFVIAFWGVAAKKNKEVVSAEQSV
ncbi:MAG: YedE family putative selenium transporter [Atopococcus tabaci]|uniref:YedE family putative selenium transporter n=1 Tax=Atopococcus tabaci TaxID=269774 RepID=A0AA43RNN7_9LACT|nr:YedE family putative selenium transporter [Atopococcus tabaci]